MSRVYSTANMGSHVVRNQKAYTKEDLVKTKFVFRLIFLIAFIAILSLVYIWSRVQVVQYGYEINKLNHTVQRLVEENKKLQVEVSALRSPDRIQYLAEKKLNMQMPRPDQIAHLK